MSDGRLIFVKTNDTQCFTNITGGVSQKNQSTHSYTRNTLLTKKKNKILCFLITNLYLCQLLAKMLTLTAVFLCRDSAKRASTMALAAPSVRHHWSKLHSALALSHLCQVRTYLYESIYYDKTSPQSLVVLQTRNI